MHFCWINVFLSFFQKSYWLFSHVCMYWISYQPPILQTERWGQNLTFSVVIDNMQQVLFIELVFVSSIRDTANDRVRDGPHHIITELHFAALIITPTKTKCKQTKIHCMTSESKTHKLSSTLLFSKLWMLAAYYYIFQSGTNSTWS